MRTMIKQTNSYSSSFSLFKIQNVPTLKIHIRPAVVDSRPYSLGQVMVPFVVGDIVAAGQAGIVHRSYWEASPWKLAEMTRLILNLEAADQRLKNTSILRHTRIHLEYVSEFENASGFTKIGVFGFAGVYTKTILGFNWLN